MDGSHSGSGLRHGPLGRRHTAEIGDGTIGRGSLLSGRNLAYACDAADLASGRRGRHPLDAETLRPAHPVGQRIAGKKAGNWSLRNNCTTGATGCSKNAGGNRNLTKQQIGGGTEPAGGIAADTPRLTRLLMRRRKPKRSYAADRSAAASKPTPCSRNASRPSRSCIRTKPWQSWLPLISEATHRPVCRISSGGRDCPSPKPGIPVGSSKSLTAERFGQRELFVHESCRAARPPASRCTCCPPTTSTDRLQRPYGRPCVRSTAQGLQ